MLPPGRYVEPTVVTPSKTPREPFGPGNRTHGKMCFQRKGHDDVIAVEKEDTVADLGGLKIWVALGHYKIRTPAMQGLLDCEKLLGNMFIPPERRSTCKIPASVCADNWGAAVQHVIRCALEVARSWSLCQARCYLRLGNEYRVHRCESDTDLFIWVTPRKPTPNLFFFFFF